MKKCKLMCFILMLVVVLGSFTGCFNDKEKDAVRNVVEGYNTALKAADMEKALTFIAVDTKLYETTRTGNEESNAWGEFITQALKMNDSYSADITESYEKLVITTSYAQEIFIDKVTISDDDKSAEVVCVGKAADEGILGEEISMETYEAIAEELYGDKVLSDEEMCKVLEEQYRRAAENVELVDVKKIIKLELREEEWKIVEVVE